MMSADRLKLIYVALWSYFELHAQGRSADARHALRVVQTWLNRYAGANLDVDGVWGKRTALAVQGVLGGTVPSGESQAVSWWTTMGYALMAASLSEEEVLGLNCDVFRVTSEVGPFVTDTLMDFERVGLPGCGEVGSPDALIGPTPSSQADKNWWWFFLAASGVLSLGYVLMKRGS